LNGALPDDLLDILRLLEAGRAADNQTVTEPKNTIAVPVPGKRFAAYSPRPGIVNARAGPVTSLAGKTRSHSLLKLEYCGDTSMGRVLPFQDSDPPIARASTKPERQGKEGRNNPDFDAKTKPSAWFCRGLSDDLRCGTFLAPFPIADLLRTKEFLGLSRKKLEPFFPQSAPYGHKGIMENLEG